MNIRPEFVQLANLHTLVRGMNYEESQLLIGWIMASLQLMAHVYVSEASKASNLRADHSLWPYEVAVELIQSIKTAIENGSSPSLPHHMKEIESVMQEFILESSKQADESNIPSC